MMFDSNLVEEQQPHLWAWFLSGVAIYLFILVNVFLSFVLGHISNRAATILAPGLMLLMSSQVNPFLGFVGGIFLILVIALFFGGLGLALRRSLQIFQLVQ